MEGSPYRTELPPGTVDPIFLHQLALRLHMTVSELLHGRGAPLSAHELAVGWPAYFRCEHRMDERARKAQEREAERTAPRRRR